MRCLDVLVVIMKENLIGFGRGRAGNLRMVSENFAKIYEKFVWILKRCVVLFDSCFMPKKNLVNFIEFKKKFLMDFLIKNN